MFVRIAAAFAVIGMTLALVSVFAGQSPPAGSSDPSVGSTHLAAIAPIDDVVDVFFARAESNPGDYVSRTHLGDALLTQAREQADPSLSREAQGQFEQALEINPDHAPARLGLARSLMAQHVLQPALSQVELVLDSDPSSTRARVLEADIEFELGRYEDAIDGYFRLLDLGPPSLVRQSKVAWLRGDVSGALELAEDALAQSHDLSMRASEAAFYWVYLAHLRAQVGDTAAAIELFEHALTIDPGNLAAGEMLAGVYAASGALDQALERYEDLIARSPAADIHGVLADVYRAAGDAESAVDHEEAAELLAATTTDPAERRHLAWYYMGNDPSEAERLARLDLDERQDIGAYETLAWALYQSDKPEQAQEAISKALAWGTREPALLYRAGAIALANGDLNGARDHLTAAIEMNPNFDLVEAPDAGRLLAEVDALS